MFGLNLRFLLVVFSLGSFAASAQVFTLSPAAVHEGELPLDAYSIHQIDMLNQTGSSLNLSWRLVENSCPHDWYIGLCDYNSCYGMLPQNGEMLPISGDIYGFIKLDVNPWLVEGEGTLHFWVYETGNFEDRIDVYFHLSTAGFSSVEYFGQSATPRLSVEPGHSRLVVSGSTENDRVLLYGLQGQLLAEWTCEGLAIEYFPITNGGFFIAAIQRGNQITSRGVLLLNP